jgi:hypothetical protein
MYYVPVLQQLRPMSLWQSYPCARHDGTAHTVSLILNVDTRWRCGKLQAPAVLLW